MKIYDNLLLLAAFCLLQIQCGKDDPVLGGGQNGGNQSEWLIPQDQVRDGGPGKDGIPSIDNPQFNSIDETTFLNDQNLVVVSKLGNQVYAYPHVVMDWHEIVNHFTPSGNLTMTYCPLTGTAIGWNPMVDGELTQFGVSGLLYNSNLMPYDRKTNSNWSQMRLDCVNGPQINTRIELIHLMETTFGTLKTLFPEALVLNTNTGINRNYGQYPYGEYRSNAQLIFPVDGEVDNSLHPKERVLGVQIEMDAIAFQLSHFEDEKSVIVEASAGGKDIIAIGNLSMNFMVAFENDLDGSKVNLTAMEITGEGIASDSNGNVYNAFGQVISGPNTGSELNEVTNYIGYWFAWAAFADIDLVP